MLFKFLEAKNSAKVPNPLLCVYKSQQKYALDYRKGGYTGLSNFKVSFKVNSTVSRAIGMIKYAKKFLPTDKLKLLYRGLIEPHLRFCCSVWGGCGASTRKILERLQNRSVRIITNSPYDAPAEPLLKSLGLPSVNNMIYQESASMVIKL